MKNKSFLALLALLLFIVFAGIIVKHKDELTEVEDASFYQGVNASGYVSKVKLIATGDVVIGRSVNYETVLHQNPLWPFENVQDFLKSGDITLANVETPYIKECPLTIEGMVFCSDEKNIQGLVAAGIDIANLANNHSSDYGRQGISNTIGLLQESGIQVTGVDFSLIQTSSQKSNIVYRTVNGTKFAFLGFDDICCTDKAIMRADETSIKKLVGEAKKNADVVVVSMHWGAEYRGEPDQRQVLLAHQVADAGADLIIGNHPHWIQPEAKYKDTYIKYAHGNLIFDQMWSEETKKGVIGEYFFEDGKLVNVKYTPTYIKNYGQPSIVGK